MATYVWSTLTDGQVINPFNPASDVLQFDGAIAAASIVVSSNAGLTQTTFVHGGKTVTLQMNWLSITTSNVTFTDGSVLRVGDNTTGTVNDDGNNILVGGSGNDQLLGMGGNDTLIGNGGDDLFIFSGSTTAGPAGNDAIDGGAGEDRLIFVTSTTGVTLQNVERIIGTNNNDTLASSAVGLIFDGRAGNDRFVGAAADGIDSVLSFESAASGVTVNLATKTASDGLGGNDTFENIDGIEGSQFNDSLTGGSNSRDATGALFEFFEGMAGNDTINGGSGTDRVDYTRSPGGVNVDLAAGTAQDGWSGTDTLISIEQVRGSAHADTLSGSAADEMFEGLAGDDVIDGRGGFDEVDYRRATAAVTVNLSTGVAQAVAANAGIGVDNLTSIEGVRGSDFNDVFTGGASDERFEGRAGNDTIVGGGGVDTASYVSAPGAANVNLATGSASDGYGNTDSLSQIENVLGSNFADVLVGNAGNNALSGGRGNDTFTGGAGDDTLTGGRGQDSAIFSSGIGSYTVTRMGAVVTVTGPDGTDQVTGVERLVFSDALWTLPNHSRIDHNLDGTSDVLWRKTDGTLANWQMNGASLTSTVLDVVHPSWNLVDAHGDYNGDGKNDLLWRNTEGWVSSWMMNGAQFTGQYLNTSVADSSWSIINGHADFNGDGKSDLLWRYTDGTLATWLMDGSQFTGHYLSAADSSWSIIDSSSDYNADGKTDLLWRNSEGWICTWLMDGATFSGHYLNVHVADASWSIVDGKGDFDGDGKSDLLWRNTNGNVAVWLMDGSQFTGHYLNSVAPTSTLVDSRGDYNGDGTNDLLWRAADGTVTMWLLNGSQLTSHTVTTASSNWTIVDGHGDHNGDGKSDLLWRSTDGSVATWLMNGAQFTGHYLNAMDASWSVVDAAEMGSAFSGDHTANTLSGTIGRDIFYAGAGNDTVTGGGGADRYVFNTALNGATNVDTITDFRPGEDRIILSDVLFTSVPVGVLDVSNFVSEAGAVAHDANDFILYDTATGSLSYDADGSGAQAAVVFAMLTNNPALAATDIQAGIF